MKKFKIKVNGEIFEVEVEEVATDNSAVIQAINRVERIQQVPVSVNDVVSKPVPIPQASVPKTLDSVKGEVRAPMAGKILKVLVENGQKVVKGQEILLLEAMKMENEIYSPFDGIINELRVKEEMVVNNGDLLAILK